MRTNRDTSAGPRRDMDAALTLRELREDRRLTCQELPREMRKAGIRPDRIPGVRTLERIEALGAIPWERYRFGLAEFFDRPVGTIWGTSARQRQRVAA